MEIGELISMYRKEAGLTIDELANQSGVPKGTLNKIINGVTKAPTLDNVKAIAKALNKTLADFDDTPTNPKKAPSISDEAKDIAKRYDELDKWGKTTVKAVINTEHERVKDKHMTTQGDNISTVEKIVYTDPAAAGMPLYAEDNYERLEFPAGEVPKGADFGVKISGNSMIPTIPDGAIVWVHQTPEINNGQIGIFMLNDAAVCKRFYKNGAKIKLMSDNTDYAPMEITEFMRFGVVGRVLEYK